MQNDNPLKTKDVKDLAQEMISQAQGMETPEVTTKYDPNKLVHQFNDKDEKFTGLFKFYEAEMLQLFMDQIPIESEKALEGFSEGSARVELAHIVSADELYFSCLGYLTEKESHQLRIIQIKEGYQVSVIYNQLIPNSNTYVIDGNLFFFTREKTKIKLFQYDFKTKKASNNSKEIVVTDDFDSIKFIDDRIKFFTYKTANDFRIGALAVVKFKDNKF